MKILKTVKSKLLVRILSVVVIGIVAIGILGSYLNFQALRQRLSPRSRSLRFKQVHVCRTVYPDMSRSSRRLVWIRVWVRISL